MSETRKLAAILVADIVGYSRLTGADEELTLARLRSLRSDLIGPTIAIHNGRVVKRTGDGAIVEFRSVVEAVRCAIEVRSALAERNAGLPEDKRIEARVGIHLGDVVEEADGDLMGDGVNIAARLEGICEPDAILLSEDAYRQVRDKIDMNFVDLGEQNLKNIARPMRAYALTAPTEGRPAARSATPVPGSLARRERRSALTPILENIVIPSIVQKSRSRKERREAVAAAVTAILEKVARPKGGEAEEAATQARPVVGSSGAVPTTVDQRSRPRSERPAINFSGAVPTVGRRSQRRRFIRFLIIVGIFATVATRIVRGPDPFATSPSPPPPAAVEDKLAKAPRLSFVVLPFANLSGDPEQDYFADGFTDDLTTDLSRLPESFVIAHSTALAYKGRATEATQLRKLGVRYAIEGSVRRVGETIAVNAQLISTETGAQIWADRLEGERNRLGELQAELVSRIANALGVRLPKAGLPAK